MRPFAIIMPRFAIVIPTLNHANHLGDAIASVQSQNGAAVDLLVRDGGSVDRTVDILRSHKELRWISEPDHGQGDAINKGLAETTGGICGWLNADDELAPGALAKVAAAFDANPDVAVVYGDARFIDEAGRDGGRCEQVEDFSFERLLTVSDFIVQPAAFFRRSAFEAVGGLDPALHWTMDYDLWLKLGRRFRFLRIPGVLARYRWSGANKTADRPASRLMEVERVVRRHGGNGLPAYFLMEAAALSWGLGDRKSAARQFIHPKILAALMEPKTWRIMAMRRRLRKPGGRVGRG